MWISSMPDSRSHVSPHLWISEGTSPTPPPVSDISGSGGSTFALGEGLDHREVRSDFEDILAFHAEGRVTKA